MSGVLGKRLRLERTPSERSHLPVPKEMAGLLDVRGIIQLPIRSRFGIRRPTIASGNEVQACLMAFNMVCTYIGTRDLVQEHIA